MKKIFFLCLITVIAVYCLAASVPVNAAAPSLQEGKWEISTELEMSGMPSDMPRQTFVHTQCLTRDDYVPQGTRTKGSGGGCEITDIRTSGDTVNWTIRCNTGQGEVTGQGSITYSGDRFTGRVNTVMQGMKMTQHLQGKRIGGCD